MIFYFLIIILMLLIYQFFDNSEESKRRITLLNKLPGPRKIPFLGSSLSLMMVPRHERIKQASINRKLYGPLYNIWAKNIANVNIMDPADVEVVLASSININKAKIYNFYKAWLGTGLLIASGQKWHKRRKLLTPAFHFSILETFFDTMVENSKTFVRTLEKEIGNDFDIFPYVSNCALDIICESAMGVKIDVQNGCSKEYLECVKRMTELIINRMLYPWLYFKWIYRRSGNYQEQKSALKVLHKMSSNVIKQRRLQRLEMEMQKDKSTPTESEDQFINRRKKRAFLDILLDMSDESGGQFSDSDIREEVDTFMFEGHDTTSSALIWSIYMLGQHLDVQDMAYEEIKTVFGDDLEKTTMKDMSQLKYLECVIKETLRHYPSVPFIARELSRDIKLSGYEIPKGTTVILHLIELHQNEQIFPEPEKFNPSHFFVENLQGRRPFSYVPFSAGPRNCIGQKFAMLELKVLLSTFLRHYKVVSLQSKESLLVAPDTIIRPLNGIYVNIERRNFS